MSWASYLKHIFIILVIIGGVIASVGIYITQRPSPEEATVPIFPIIIQDDLGRNVTISKYPERIVSLAPVNTEILFALGLRDEVVGVTMYCDYPPEVKDLVTDGKITIIGGFADPNIEKIVALEPDLILAVGGIQVVFVEQFEKLGLAAVVLEPKKLDEALKNIVLVGEITGHVETAHKLVDNMKERIDRINSLMENANYRPRVYYELWYDPLMTFGSETWVDELIGLAGGVNIYHDAKVLYPGISAESVIKRNPEVIIVNIGYMGGMTSEQFETRSGWGIIDAVKNDRVYAVDEDILIRPGPRIVEGLERLAKVIHPELFGE